MKGDYSQAGLMPSRYREQIDLPFAYLVFGIESCSRREEQRSPGGPFYRRAFIGLGLLSDLFVRDLVEITVLIGV